MLESGTATAHYTATLSDGQLVTSNVPWSVTAVEPLPDFQLHVKFIDGTGGLVKMREMIFSDTAGVFKSLRDPSLFAAVGVEDGVVLWANGLDLAPDAMHDEIERHDEWVLR